MASLTAAITGLRIRRVPIQAKLTILVTLIICLTTAVIGYLVLNWQGRQLHDGLVARGNALVQYLAKNASSSLLEQDALALNVLVEEAKKNKDVAYAAVLDAGLVILAHNDLQYVGKVYAAENKSEARSILAFTAPVRFQAKELGRILLGLNQEGMQASLGRAKLFIILLMLGVIGFGIVVSFYVSTIVARPIHLLAQASRAIGERDFHHRLPPLSVGRGQDELTDLGKVFNEMAEDLRQKERLQDSFGRYVSPHIAEMILKSVDGPWLGPKRYEVTVLFVDIRGYTPYVERTAPASVIEMLNQFFEVATEAIIRQGGFINKFLGDSLMAVFGVPMPQPDQAYRAALAALEIRSGMEDFNRTRLADGKDPIGIGIGINRGDVVAGSVGSSARMEYTVVGDAVNVASWLTTLAKGSEILISRTALDPVSDRFQVDPLPPLTVKGKTELIEVFLLVGTRNGDC